MQSLIDALGPSDDIELDSRLFYFPTCYLDPWTKAAVDDYCAKITKKKWDPEFVAELNGLADVQQFVRVHSGTEYWVAALGFWPGLPFMMALDPRCVLTAPKYNPPRTWTPQGTIGMGGASTAIYPVATPAAIRSSGASRCRSGTRRSASRNFPRASACSAPATG
jgi:Allophanate hydrolase subunit 1